MAKISLSIYNPLNNISFFFFFLFLCHFILNFCSDSSLNEVKGLLKGLGPGPVATPPFGPYPGGIGQVPQIAPVPQYGPGCPLCDSSVYSYCPRKMIHDACCCNAGTGIQYFHHFSFSFSYRIPFKQETFHFHVHHPIAHIWMQTPVMSTCYCFDAAVIIHSINW